MSAYMTLNKTKDQLTVAQFGDGGLLFEYSYCVYDLICIDLNSDGMMWGWGKKEFLERLTFSCPRSCVQ